MQELSVDQMRSSVNPSFIENISFSKSAKRKVLLTVKSLSLSLSLSHSQTELCLPAFNFMKRNL